MSLLAGYSLRQMQKDNARKIGDHGIFTPNSQYKHRRTKQKHTGDEAYLKFLKEEQDLRYRQMKKSDRQRVALVTVYCLLPILLFLLGYWRFAH